MLLHFTEYLFRVSSCPLCPSGIPIRNGDPWPHSITLFRKSELFFPLFLLLIKRNRVVLKRNSLELSLVPFPKSSHIYNSFLKLILTFCSILKNLNINFIRLAPLTPPAVSKITSINCPVLPGGKC